MSIDKEVIEQVAKVVIKEMNKVQNKKANYHKDRRLRNTKLLVENHRLLSKHCEGINDDLEIYETLVYDPTQLELHALMKYKAKTKRMLNYFDSQLERYKEFCNKNGPMAERRYKILYAMYIDEHKKSADDIASFYSLDRSTVFRDVKKATEELSIFLFGLDSLNDLHATKMP